MELLYIWIDNYKNIKNQGFNFSPNYHFTYNHNTHVLDFEKKEEVGLPPNFWGKNVMNLTLLLGKNGAGKSSVLEVIKSAHKQNKVVIVFKNKDDTFHCYFGGVNEPICERYNVKFEKFKFEKNNFKHLITYYSPIFRAEDTIENNRSPIANDVEPGSEGNIIYPFQIYDITTQNLLNGKLKKINSELYNIKRKCYDKYSDSTPNISDTEKLRNLFTEINFGDFQKTNFNLLEQLRLDDFEHVLNILEKKLFVSKDTDFKNINVVVRPLPNTLSDLDFVKFNFQISFYKTIINSMSDLVEKFISGTLLGEICYIFSNIWLYDEEKNLPLIKEIEGNITITEYYKKLLQILGHNGDDFPELEFIQKNVEQNKDYISADGLEIVFSNNLENVTKFLPRVKNYNKTKEELFPIFKYEFRGLSSGELYLLTMLGRISTASGVDNSKLLLFLIDEGETTLHPHWQKQYIKWLVEYVPLMFPDKKIQFIITSNNPIIASDVPSSNIIRLKTNEDGLCKIAETPTKTFGANIYDLLKDSFFIEDGFMGDFAKKKINDVLNWLNASDRELSQKQDVLQIIESIGEPILRQKLLEKYEEVTGQNAKLLKIQRKIKELKDEEANLLNSAKK